MAIWTLKGIVIKSDQRHWRWSVIATSHKLMSELICQRGGKIPVYSRVISTRRTYRTLTSHCTVISLVCDKRAFNFPPDVGTDSYRSLFSVHRKKLEGISIKYIKQKVDSSSEFFFHKEFNKTNKKVYFTGNNVCLSTFGWDAINAIFVLHLCHYIYALASS